MIAANELASEMTGLNILPDGTRVFFRDAFLFRDISQQVGTVVGWNVSNEAADWLGTPELEYFVRMPDGTEHWISASLVEGFLRAA